jgi:hypothetical protein
MAHQTTGSAAIPGQQADQPQEEWQTPQDFWRCLRQQPVSGRYEADWSRPVRPPSFASCWTSGSTSTPRTRTRRC